MEMEEGWENTRLERESAESHQRRYDSFVVRIWREGHSTSHLLRAEVQHVQSGLAMKGVDASLDWIAVAIERMLSGEQNPEREDRGAFLDF